MARKFLSEQEMADILENMSDSGDEASEEENYTSEPSDYDSESNDDDVDNILQTNVIVQPVQSIPSKDKTINWE